MSKTKLKIKEFSLLCQVTVKTLRHYEKVGLLKPSEVETAIRNHLHVVYIVLCDKQWGMVKMNQHFALRPIKTMIKKTLDPHESINADLGEIRFDLLAQSMGGHGEFGYKDITFSPEFYGWLCDETERFWKDNVLGGVEPEAIDVRDVLLKYSRHTEGRLVEVGDEVFRDYQDLKDVRKQIDALTERNETLEGRIKMAFGDAEAITYGGDTLATWKAPKPSMKFDTALFKDKYPNIYDEFTVPVQGSRRFLLK